MKTLFTSLPASGHLHPLVPIALAAREAGRALHPAIAPATLCNGLPIVLTPIGVDQPFHADRCRDLGVAVVVDQSEFSPQRIRCGV
jgi:UDP:flavonoid glycosyltransferase YjiC (YdhE family)